MKEKIVLLNDLVPKLDLALNGSYYDEENQDTAVVYEHFNMVTNKSYIGLSNIL